ncbi:MAG: hypothetical protein VX498_07440 [Myxococcota bacterium]|nr:hypothetical protein [Myxococcota bacterium]
MQKSATLWINVLGGLAVLGSYAYGLGTHPEQGQQLWGTIPEGLRGIYTGMRLPAAVGYLTFTGYVLLASPASLRISDRPILTILNVNYAIFLVTAATWMPLCWIALDGQAEWLLLPIQGVLALTGLASLGFVALLVFLDDPPKPRFRKLALAGAICLFIQCGILDALVWPRFFTLG